MNAPDKGSRNRLLAMLPLADRDLLTPSLEEVGLSLRQCLEASNHPISHVYFVEEGLASVVACVPGERIEVGLVGYEGMTGLSAVLDADQSANETLV